MIVNFDSLEASAARFSGASPFDHVVVDDFFSAEHASLLEAEFPSFDDRDVWYEYENAIEYKRACNNWNLFPEATYSAFNYLNSEVFCTKIGQILGLRGLRSDPGLNGGGWHAHARGGKLNPHLDYNLHPKLGLQRKLNIIVYLNSNWQSEWGGQLGFWEKGDRGDRPGALIRSIEPVFNRAVIFDTTQDSWHGLPTPLDCPDGEIRKSLAVYYLQPAPKHADPRGKALFAPMEDQMDDEQIIELIRLRSDTRTASKVYT